MRLSDDSWQQINQAVYGNDFWQTDYDPGSGTWECTFTVASDTVGDQSQRRMFRFRVD